jgi:hypothetical protein
MASPRVWWTIPGSPVAWEWVPGDAVAHTGRLTDEGGALRFEAAERWTPMWTSARMREAFQALKDLTALFAEECNVLPGDMRILWVGGDRAVSWHRATGRLSRHDVMPPRAGAGRSVRAEATSLGGATADLRTADARARAELRP